MQWECALPLARRNVCNVVRLRRKGEKAKLSSESAFKKTEKKRDLFVKKSEFKNCSYGPKNTAGSTQTAPDSSCDNESLVETAYCLMRPRNTPQKDPRNRDVHVDTITPNDPCGTGGKGF